MFFQNNVEEITALFGLFILMIDVWVLGFTSIILLILGITSIVTALFISFGILPDTFSSAIGFSGFSAASLIYIFWKPLKRIQVIDQSKFNIHNDYIGLTFMLLSDLSEKKTIIVKYSGINWNIILAPSHSGLILRIGTCVKVIAIDVGKFIVIPEEVLSLQDNVQESTPVLNHFPNLHQHSCVIVQREAVENASNIGLPSNSANKLTMKV